MRLAVSLLLLLSAAPLVHAQAPLTEADALMTRFATAWSTDDAEALRALFHDDVHLMGLKEERGIDAVMAWAAAQMAGDAVLVLDPLQSVVQGPRAYQVGRWGMGDATGVHTFVWEQDGAGRWRIVSMYILNDAAI